MALLPSVTGNFACYKQAIESAHERASSVAFTRCYSHFHLMSDQLDYGLQVASEAMVCARLIQGSVPHGCSWHKIFKLFSNQICSHLVLPEGPVLASVQRGITEAA